MSSYLASSDVREESEDPDCDRTESRERVVTVLDPVRRGRSDSVADCLELQRADFWRGQWLRMVLRRISEQPWRTFPPKRVSERS